MYGNALDEWVAARRRLLTPPYRRAFSNDFTDALGLSD
jgi:hypothetical protein